MLAELLLVAVFVYLLAGVVKGTLGLGLPTTAVSLMAMLVDARTAVAVVIIPMVVLNAWQIYRQAMLIHTWKYYWPYALSLSVVILLTGLFAVNVSVRGVTFVLGVVVAGYAVMSLWKRVPALPERWDLMAQIVAGFFSGVIGGIAGLWSPPMLMYLSAKRLPREEFVGVTGMFLFAGSIFLLIGYLYNGLLNTEIAKLSLLLLPVSLIGFTVGERLRRRINAKQFERYVLIFFLFAGFNLLYRAWRM
ncbi:MAG: sulfite exporter TauE/SafE family protein [Gammaproteobacteria bacterium]|nr:sulfite exporter TauE/SafE family protein [Gammaproteobacteria bacterium]